MADSVSDEIESWLESDGENTLGSLVELFERKSFAILFVLLLGVPALPLPTGGATLGVMLEDVVVVVLALVIGVAGVALEIVLGSAAIHEIGKLL